MKTIFEIHHPKHYHQVKNMLPLIDQYIFVVKSRDIVEDLLTREGVPFKVIGKKRKNVLSKLLNSLTVLWELNKIIRKYKPRYVVSKASPYSAILSIFYKYQNVITPDAEIVWLTNHFVSKFAHKIITQHSFERNFGKKHLKLETFFESLYLHPNYFSVDQDLLAKHNISEGDNIIFLRFIKWDASHDIGKKGLTIEQKEKLVNQLKEFGKIYISSEGDLPDSLQKYKVDFPVNIVHHVMAVSKLYFGDSQSMATESSLLGTPSIRVSPFAGDNDMSNFRNLESELGLLYNFRSFDEALNKAIELASTDKKKEWQHKRKLYYSSIPDPVKQLKRLIYEY